MQSSMQSQTAKVAILDHTGLLNASKDLSFDKCHVSSIKLSKDRISILCNSTDAFSASILVFDKNISLLWQKDLGDRVVDNTIIESSRSDQITVIKTETVESFQMDDGKSNWKLDRETEKGTSELEIITAKYILSGDYFATITGKKTDGSSKINDNQLKVFNADSGKQVYLDELGSSEKKMNVISGKRQFVILSDNVPILYKN